MGAQTHTHRRIRLCSDEQHHNPVLGARARLVTSGSILCYNLTMRRRTATTSNGSKSFDPKTSSTRAAAGSKSMTNPYHTQKIDSEPSRLMEIMQKSYSPDATFVMSFMVTNNTHSRLP